MMIILIRSGAQSLNPALIAKMHTMNLRWLQYEWSTNPYVYSTSRMWQIIQTRVTEEWIIGVTYKMLNYM